MGYLGGIDDNSKNYAEKYKQSGEQVLSDTKIKLSRLGIKIFPTDTNDSSENNGNVDSCVIVNSDNSAKNQPQKENTTVTTQNKDKNTKRTNISWIRDALSGSADPNNLLGGVSEDCMESFADEKQYVQKTKDNSNNDNSGTDDTEDKYDEYDIHNSEKAIDDIQQLSNASDDEGEGKPLQTLFEHDVESGFHSSNFGGTKFKKDYKQSVTEHRLTVYTDNSYKSKKGTTSIIGGGTFSYSDYVDKAATEEKEEGKNNNRNIDFNAYLFGKYNLLPDIQVGAGAICDGKNDTYTVDSNMGVYHEKTGLYAIAYNNSSFIPGLPVQSKTDIVAGIGKASGMLNPDEYNKKDTSIENISDVDNVAQYVESQEKKSSESESYTNRLSDTTLNFIYSKTEDNQKYGLKAGRIFRFTNKNNNNAFIMPYGQVCSTKVDSHSGINYELGVHTGQRADLKNGWEIKTKGVIEYSGESVEGSGASYSLLGNVNFKASNKKNFDAEVSVGGICGNTGTRCFYTEAKINYALNKYTTLHLKGGYAKSKFDEETSDLAEFAAGVKVNF